MKNYSLTEIEQFILDAGCENKGFGGTYEGGIHLQQAPDELAPCLVELLKYKDGIKSFLEIGSAAGGSAYVFNHFFNFNKIVLIDDNSLDRVRLRKEILKDMNYQEITGRSDNDAVIKTVSDLNMLFDLLLIDGDHSYAGVKSDVTSYLRFLRPGGFLFLHDSIYSLQGVGHLVQELKAEKGMEFIGEYDSQKYQKFGIALFQKSINRMKVGICAIIKDCYEPYLLEWLNHHRSIGVDYFFIYDNESETPISKTIEGIDFREDIYVTEVHGKVKQFYSYEKCLGDIKNGVLPKCDRVAFIDDDEFIVCENNDIKETLNEYAEFSGIGISWRMFGSSGIMEKSPKPQREKFIYHTRSDYPANRHIKSIVNPFLVIGPAGNPHAFSYTTGYCVDVDKNFIENAFSKPIYRKLWINHYWTRSLEDWKEKIAKGRADILNGKRSLEEINEIDSNCSECIKRPEGKNQIHLIMPFFRQHLKDILIEAYRPMDIIWHPIIFQDEVTEFKESWIFPAIIPMDSKDCKTIPGNFKRNWFIKNGEIIDDNYYVAADDDDMYEAGIFDKIRQMDADIVIISMKRGYQVPVDAAPIRRYPTTTLYAHPGNVQIGSISGQQSFVKGKIFKQHFFNEGSGVWDYEMAIHHKESGEQIAYRPDLFALFNYYEPGRWDQGIHKIIFGCMVNNLIRLNAILRNSEIGNSPCYTIMNPESAAKGLNKLLDIIEKKGAEIGVLTHQDVYYRRHWINQVQSQLALLPENWVIAGIVGKDEKGNLCGRFHDMSTPLCVGSDHEFPVECSCLDECVIIVNMKSGFRFDETMEGFDLYGTYAVMRAREMGTAWIIDAWAEHYCGRFHRGWEPDDKFMATWKWLYDRFPGQKLFSTVLVE